MTLIGWYAPLDGLEFAEGIAEDVISVLGVEIINSNTARVYLSEEPRHFSPLSQRDAYLRDNWAISIVSGPGRAPAVEKAENALPQPTKFAGIPLAWSVDIRTDTRFLAQTTYLVVASPTIRTADNRTGMAIPPDDRGEAPGIIGARDPKLGPTRPASLGIDLRYDIFTGRLVLDAKNDIDVQGGLEAVRKRIIRRMITSKGGFYYLPDYGLGIQPKTLVRQTSRSILEADIREQILSEPDVVAVSVQITQLAVGMYLFTIQARTRQGSVPAIQLRANDHGQIFVA